MLTLSSKKETSLPAIDSAERERLLQENLPEVRYIARRIHDRLPPHVPFDDLVHAGILGLIDAVDRYDPSRNVQLKSYARFRIRGAILDSLRQMDWSPRALRRQARRIEEAQRELSTTLGHSPNEVEVAAYLDVPLAEYQRLLGELRGLDLGSLYVGSNDESGETPHPALATKDEEDPFEQCLRSELRSMLASAIDELDEKERHVLGLYYLEELTMKEVGVILDIGESRVSQIHTAAILRLRGRLREKLAAQRAEKNSAS
ncbi:MAG TPA: FliA/WhiG family RNA polymerase sigma factor [Dongiaceae bacterium]|nr:FliA/WhiG family RNA polymerase sigma factor [Dongiaceae bacterium]